MSMTAAEFKRFLRPHKRALRKLLMDFEFFVEDVGTLNVFSVSSRLKEYLSAMKKAGRLNLEVEELQDLAGIRIVVATQLEIEVVARFFYREQDSKDLTIKSDQRLRKENGYCARHIVLESQPSYSRSMHPAIVEVQLASIFEHAFNFISRTWFYNTPHHLPENWQADFVTLSKELQSIDAKADLLHSAILDSPFTMADEATISPMSYQRLVMKVFGEVISDSDAVDYCRYMVDLGCSTNRDLREFFENPMIIELREKMLASPSTYTKKMKPALAKMSRHGFWLSFGLRYDYTMAEMESSNV